MKVHLALDDLNIDQNILKWNCNILKINRTKRHSDAIAMNKFWNLVDSFVKINRPDIQKEMDKIIMRTKL